MRRGVRSGPHGPAPVRSSGSQRPTQRHWVIGLNSPRRLTGLGLANTTHETSSAAFKVRRIEGPMLLVQPFWCVQRWQARPGPGRR